MEKKFTQGKWVGITNQGVFIDGKGESPVFETGCGCCTSGKLTEHDALLISRAPEMLEMIIELCEDLAFQLDRLGVCGQGDGVGRKADVESYGGTELLEKAKQLIKQATEL